MRTLAIDTATEACSVALFDDDRLVAHRHEVVGRGHAEKLAPMIAGLPGRGRAGRVLVDCGPGSFTGLRVGLSMARALALAWKAECAGYSSLALMAAAEFAKKDVPHRLAVAILGGHGEMFVERFQRTPFASLAPFASLRPDAAAEAIEAPLVIGNAAHELIALRGGGEAREALPDAAALSCLPDELRNLPPAPIYGRAPDAKPQQ